MLVVNLSDESHSYSKFQKCEKHGINMTAISEISKLSWRAIEEDYSLDRYEEELEKIKSKKRNYTPYLVAIGAGFACGGFCKLFGSDWVAFLFASIAAFAGFRVRARCIEFGINLYKSRRCEDSPQVIPNKPPHDSYCVQCDWYRQHSPLIFSLYEAINQASCAR